MQPTRPAVLTAEAVGVDERVVHVASLLHGAHQQRVAAQRGPAVVRACAGERSRAG
jgi:predicted ABC-type transport system involved in lysophospholipase L1 biosynthesis ATPase subunit